MTLHTDPGNEVEPTVKHGLDVNRYEQFIEFASRNPDTVRGELAVIGEYEGTAYHSSFHLGRYEMGGEEAGTQRDYTLHIGVPREFEEAIGHVDPVDRMESLEVALGALTTCIDSTIAQAALLEGHDIDHIRTTVRLPIDLRVLLGIESTDQRDTLVGDLSIDIEVEGGGLDVSDREHLVQMVNRSPVYALVTLAHPTEPTVRIVSEAE